MGIAFRLVTPEERENELHESPDEGGCRCGEQTVFGLEVDMGGVGLACRTCGLPPDYPDWEQEICLDRILVRLAVEKPPCTCSMMDQLSCDCGTYLVATVVETEKEKEA